MDQQLCDLGINPYDVKGLRIKAREWMHIARMSSKTQRPECVRLARKNWHAANSLDRTYRQYPALALPLAHQQAAS